MTSKAGLAFRLRRIPARTKVSPYKMMRIFLFMAIIEYQIRESGTMSLGLSKTTGFPLLKTTASLGGETVVLASEQFSMNGELFPVHLFLFTVHCLLMTV